jgi:transcription initiation factor IIE alpha subunit
MMDERGFVSAQKEKDRPERKTFRFEVKTLLNACSALKAQILKALKKCLRMD